MDSKKEDVESLTKALNLIGDKWSMLILHHLKQNGSMRYKECQEADGISSRTLTLRLNALENAGLILKKEYNEYPPRTEYTITKKGLAVTPALDAMAEWSKKFL
ncbi:MAG TPA: helix-turn-helix domain-containing protein [Candidatus Limnocylindria bacterium]|nr:helix-turn-helix domain-containing protein [Candidatus Limnocylindria bacterium]